MDLITISENSYMEVNSLSSVNSMKNTGSLKLTKNNIIQLGSGFDQDMPGSDVIHDSENISDKLEHIIKYTNKMLGGDPIEILRDVTDYPSNTDYNNGDYYDLIRKNERVGTETIGTITSNTNLNINNKPFVQLSSLDPNKVVPNPLAKYNSINSESMAQSTLNNKTKLSSVKKDTDYLSKLNMTGSKTNAKYENKNSSEKTIENYNNMTYYSKKNKYTAPKSNTSSEETSILSSNNVDEDTDTISPMSPTTETPINFDNDDKLSYQGRNRYKKYKKPVKVEITHQNKYPIRTQKGGYDNVSSDIFTING